MSKTNLIAIELAAVGGGAPTAPIQKPPAVARVYQKMADVRAIQNEASRLWWTGNPNDRATAVFMLRTAGLPVN